ncbi:MULTISPECIES: cytochrome b [unclassified Sphingomonas]|uniref:cytochrome b n=1 Tax=unclassified Sphingomonas TaxID=196159 RepID=UPI000FF7DAA2|nr:MULTISPECIES: cytochrome b [unclassified Sphingomonas]RKE54237.1 cytochrome b561 [Sphingomonas sp. PP-CC-1A-547]TCM00055.1 cytochrome b561 [Sphingomonas sp. PP-CC-3G-468]
MTDTHNGITRYNNGAIAFHWIIAALVVAQIYVGWTFADMERGDLRTEWFNWHKTLGFAILLLSIGRLGWRIANPPPPLPAETPRWEVVLARINHILFYVILIGLPLTGWMYLSTGKPSLTSATTPLIGGLAWPFIPGLPRAAHGSFEQAHIVLVWLTYALLILHVGAALKHQFIDRSRIAGRMPPFGVRKTR